MTETGGAIGKVLGGRYRLHRFIAQGGMGEVYEGTDEKAPGKRVAVKLLHTQFTDDDDLLARMRREARVAQNIDSPHVARVFQAGVNRERRGWIVFEFLDGESLDVRLRRESRLPFEEVAWIVEHALLGLGAAHDVGVVHRDIKPANLFLEREPKQLRVLDFGVAKQLRSDIATAASALTQTSPLTKFGDVLGTPSYMSPEQLEDSQDIDARTDIYSVGLVAYRVLTGGLPFERQELRALFELKRIGTLASLAHASGVVWPHALESWIQRAVARQRQNRFESARAALVAWHDAITAMKDYQHVAAPVDHAHEDTDLATDSV